MTLLSGQVLVDHHLLHGINRGCVSTLGDELQHICTGTGVCANEEDAFKPLVMLRTPRL
jgi:hypothetical protein